LGPYLADWVTVLPYIAVLVAIISNARPTDLEALSGGELLGRVAFMTLFFGTLLGFVLFRDEGTAASQANESAEGALLAPPATARYVSLQGLRGSGRTAPSQLICTTLGG
jgi:hypothetical protein